MIHEAWTTMETDVGSRSTNEATRSDGDGRI